MTIETHDLMANVYAFFVDRFKDLATSTTFFALEREGRVVSPETFRLADASHTLSPQLATEYLSTQLANAVPKILDDGSIFPSLHSMAGWAEQVVDQATPMSASGGQADRFNAMKRKAVQGFEMSRVGSLDGLFEYLPVRAAPANWYDPAAEVWAPCNFFSEQQGAPVGAPAPIEPTAVTRPRIVIIPQSTPQATFRSPHLGPPAAALASSPERALPSNQGFPAAVPRPIISFSFRPRVPTKTLMAAVASRPVAPPAASAAVQPPSPPKPVTTKKMSLFFEHTLVLLNRQWWPDDFLMQQDWYLPGEEAGSISSGKGPSDPGEMPFVTIGFVAIRKVSIAAEWSQDDLAAIPHATSVGPIAIGADSVFDVGSGTLTAPGVQIIGWLCEALPRLPPAADPASATKSDGAAPPRSSTTVPATSSASQGASTDPSAVTPPEPPAPIAVVAGPTPTSAVPPTLSETSQQQTTQSN